MEPSNKINTLNQKLDIIINKLIEIDLDGIENDITNKKILNKFSNINYKLSQLESILKQKKNNIDYILSKAD